MGKILQRYFLIEIGSVFLGGLATLTLLLFVVRVIDLVDLVFARGVPAVEVAGLFAYIIPSFLETAIPMAALLAVVVGLGRLSGDHELLALRSAGVNLFQMLVPVALFAAIVTIVSLAVALEVRPWSKREIKQAFFDIAKTRATAALRPRVFNTDFDGMVIYVDAVDADAGLLSGVMLADEREDFTRTAVFAESGRVMGQDSDRRIFLRLLDGTSVTSNASERSYERTDFASLEVTLSAAHEFDEMPSGVVEPGELDWDDLSAARQTRLAAGEPALAETLEMHRKFAGPAATFLLAILGMPLALRPTRAVRARGMGVTMAVVLGYFAVLSTATTLAAGGRIPPGLAMWMPDLVLAALTGYALRRAALDRRLVPALPAALRRRRAVAQGPERS